MATVQIDGSSATTVQSTVNNGGTIKADGTVSSGVVDAQSPALERSTVFASTVLDNGHADKALSSGTFAFNNQSPVAKRVTESLSGVANTVLQSGASVPSLRQSIHKIESKRVRRVATAVRAGYWNIYSGAFGTTPTAANDSFGNDEAARPSADVPGELTYMDGSPTPVNDNYKAKTSF